MVAQNGYRFKMILRPYQEQGLQALWQYFMTNSGNPVIAWPTGTGKSWLPAIFIQRALHYYQNQRFILATHVKELIQQNYDKVIEAWPEAPIGIYSAGLKRRDILPPIIYGGVKSMYKIAHAFGHRDIAFVDECHLLSQDENSMYHELFSKLKGINPKLKIIGMSATPFRVGQGMITDGGLFTDIAHDLTSLDNFNKLIEDGWLCPLIPKKTQVELDVSNVGIQQGEFIASQLQHEVDKAEVTWKALHEAMYYGQNRRSWLIFASGIDHAEHIATMLSQLGVECAAVHSKQDATFNDNAIKAFKSYQIRAIVNYGKLTTGFDHPGIDLIIMLRPTMSVSLWVQMLGRGTRPLPDKQNCLVLDFARNTPRLGPINDPVIPHKKGNKVGELPVKICDACGVYNHIKAVKCDACGAPFEFEVKIKAKAGTEELIKVPEAMQIEYFNVNHVIYKPRQKQDKPPYIEVTYFSGMNQFKEFQFPQSKNRSFFSNWWRQRHTSEPPKTAEEALQFTSHLRRPSKIRVHVNRMINGRNLPEVLSCEF